MRVIVCLLAFMISFQVYAQREIIESDENWFGIMTAGQISPNYAFWVDSHFVNELFWIIRTGITYRSDNNRWAITGGYSYLRLRAPFSDGRLVRPEHRPWGQVIYRVPSKSRLSTSFRFRYDMRFRANVSQTGFEDGYEFNNRLRFNNALRYDFRDAISKKFNFATSLLNESLITLGPDPVANPYEHRIFTMLNFNRKSVTISPGYIVRFLNFTPTTVQVRHGFVFWVSLNYRFGDYKNRNFRIFPSDRL